MNRRQRDEARAFDEAWEARARAPRSSWDHEVAELVACAEQLCEAAIAEPSPEFRTALRTQLMTEAATVLAPVGTRPVRPHRAPVRTPSFGFRRRLAGATAALVTAGGFVGLVGASAEALPGEMLYPVKRGVENVELAFHKDDPARGEFRLAQASERLAEARRLTDDGSPQSSEHVAGALDDFATQARDGAGALFRAYGQSGSQQSITDVNDFSAAAAADLAQLSGRVPADADPSFQAAATTVSELVTKASRLCTSCGTADVTGLVGAVSSLGGATPDGAAGQSTDPAGGLTDGSTPEVPIDESTVPEAPKIIIPSLPALEPTPPSTSSTQDPPKIKKLTDPLVGTLLGDDDQQGVVPNLLDGLLKPPS
jgi:hypothetical protein